LCFANTPLDRIHNGGRANLNQGLGQFVQASKSKSEMKDRFIDDFVVILLDMGNTFMFGGDRFEANSDYHGIYRELGGQSLSAEQLNRGISELVDRMVRAYRDAARYDDFGNVWRFLREDRALSRLPFDEQERIVEVFSRHEIGVVPETHKEALAQLRRTHLLGIVSNVWSPSGVFESSLEAGGIRDLFAVRVWSSDHVSIKPSPRLFQRALEFFGAKASRAVYVGDDPLRDVAGAKAVGMATVWIENKKRLLTPSISHPDLILSDLTELPGKLKK
jgi:FMN phosphatase YigB (HAD superfamily)